MKILPFGFAILLGAGCATAVSSKPALGLITTDNNGGWLLFTDQNHIFDNDKIYILGTDPELHAACCAHIIGPTAAPKEMTGFFSDVLHTNLPAKQRVFHISLPEGAVSADNPNAMAVWGVENVTVTKDGYALHTPNPADRYMANACFGTEGINIFMRDAASRPALVAHYYGYFGYEIGDGNCPN